ncbi:MAG: O-antigen ligase family protein [Planctomycetaceae bacterium]|nr:O-antigen ligase family protein [Planctomycetaceae bacterium]
MHIFEGTSTQIDTGDFGYLNRSRFQDLVFQIGVVLAIITGFTIPVSTSLTSVCNLGIFICWGLSGQYRVTFACFKKYRIVTISVILFCCLACSLLYTPELLSLASRNLFKYRQFLMMPIYLTFFMDPRARLRGIQMFELAMIITLIASLLCWIFSIDNSVRLMDNAIFKNRITQNILMSFLVYLSLWKFLEQPSRRWPYALIAVIAAYDILAVVPGRSGYLALVILIGLLMYQKLGVKGILPAAVCVGLIGIVTYHHSERFHKRIDQVVKEIKEYRISNKSRSSVDLRLEFYGNGLQIAKSSPLLGSGIGSFAMKYRELMKQKGQLVTENPHNEYVMLLVQNGIIGVGLFLAFFWVSWQTTRGLTGIDQALGQAVLAVYLFVCMVNSLMLDTTEGCLFGYLVGLTLAGGVTGIKETQQNEPLKSMTNHPSQEESSREAA